MIPVPSVVRSSPVDDGRVPSSWLNNARELLERTGRHCAFCGVHIQHSKMLRLVDLAGEYRVLTEHVRPACIICGDIHRLGHAGALSAGVLAYVPEMPQKAVNALAYGAISVSSNQEDYEYAECSLDYLSARSSVEHQLHGFRLNDLLAVSSLLYHMEKIKYDRRAHAFQSIRYIPNLKRLCTRLGEGISVLQKRYQVSEGHQILEQLRR